MGVKKIMERWAKSPRPLCCADFAIDTSNLYYTIEPLTKMFRQRVLPPTYR